jgi:diacylglycerol kinase (ATP)
MKFLSNLTKIFVYSGGLQGQVVFEQLRIQIGEENVYDLVKDKGPQQGLKENQNERNLKIIGLYFLSRISLFFLILFSILACGGDGTVGWVLSALDLSQMQYMDFVSVGVIPLGTGNDMARFLGWGVGYRGESLAPVIQSLAKCETRLLDRWHIDIQPTAHTGIASLIVSEDTNNSNEQSNQFILDSTTCF